MYPALLCLLEGDCTKHGSLVPYDDQIVARVDNQNALLAIDDNMYFLELN